MASPPKVVKLQDDLPPPAPEQARPEHGLEALSWPAPPDHVLGASGRTYTSTSCHCLRPGSFPRRLCIYAVEWRWFDPFILLTILANCVTMAWESPLDPPGTLKATIIGYCEQTFLAIFTIELFIKVTAFGLLGSKHSYLRDPWCQLDFVVVSLAWAPILFPGFANLSAVRSVRALRPLRALKHVPGMPVLINAILTTLPKLGTVVILCIFIFLVLAIVYASQPSNSGAVGLALAVLACRASSAVCDHPQARPTSEPAASAGWRRALHGLSALPLRATRV